MNPQPTPPRSGGEADPETTEKWRAILLGTDPAFARSRNVLKHLRSAPRCKMCAAPFAGPLSGVTGLLGRRPWAKNPKYCRFCFHQLQTHHGGAEIECSLLFADVRGSTALAERMTSADFARVMERFYRVAADILIDHDAIVDKFVGDEVVAIFIPALAHERHAARAVEAAEVLLRATGHGASGASWIPLGAGVASGTAYVGAVGGEADPELTALGDIVNVAARLASAAAAGELLVTTRAAEAAGIDSAAHETRRLNLRGKSEPVDVVVLRASANAS
jgi:adenylate cyclase